MERFFFCSVYFVLATLSRAIKVRINWYFLWLVLPFSEDATSFVFR